MVLHASARLRQGAGLAGSSRRKPGVSKTTQAGQRLACRLRESATEVSIFLVVGHDHELSARRASDSVWLGVGEAGLNSGRASLNNSAGCTRDQQGRLRAGIMVLPPASGQGQRRQSIACTTPGVHSQPPAWRPLAHPRGRA